MLRQISLNYPGGPHQITGFSHVQEEERGVRGHVAMKTRTSEDREGVGMRPVRLR